MPSDLHDLLTALAWIDPAACTYQEWCDVGMALKYEGCTVSIWDSWSRRDMARYHSGECERKWQTFSNTRTPCVTGGTIMQMAMDRGYRQETGENLPISPDGAIYIDPGPQSIRIVPAVPCPRESSRSLTEPPPQWDPCQDIRDFLERLFLPDDYVGYVMKSMEQGERYVPSGRGVYGREQRHIIKALEASHDVGYALGDYDPRGGAWVRINPLNGTYIRWIRRGGLEPYNLHQQNRRFSMLTDKMFQTILQAAEKGDEQTYTYYLCYASDIENVPDTDMVLESVLTSVLYQINDLHDPVLFHYILHKLQNPIRTFLLYIEEENVDTLRYYALDCIRLDLLFMILWFLTPKSRQVLEADCWLKKNAEHLLNIHLQSLYEQWSQEIQDFALVPDNAEQIECIF